MRVLFVTHNVPRFAGDAAGSFVLRLAVALQQRGHRIDVIAPGAPGLAATDVLEGVRIERVPYARDDRMNLAYTGTMAESVRRSWSARFALIGLMRALRRATQRALHDARVRGEPYTAVHVHWWFPSGLALWRAFRRDQPPIVLTMHGSDVRLASSIAAAHPLLRGVLRQASVRTSVSSFLRDTVQAMAPGVPIDVEPMPVDTRYFGPDAGNEARHGILFVGRLNTQKGISFLLDAVATDSLARATLDVVGDGPDASALRERATALGLARRVTWHGALPQPALVPLYQRAACVAMPSTDEGLGLVAVEAQLCGTPVVGFDSGGLRDVVRDDAGGTLVAPGDMRAFCASIARLLGDPDEARRRGSLARDAMLARFTPEIVAERYEALYARAEHARAEHARV